MSRDTGGNYTLPHSFTPGTTIRSNDVNENFSNLGNEITNSLSRFGWGPMLAQLKTISGTAAAPSYSFTEDPGVGIWLPAANTMRVTANAADLQTWGLTSITMSRPTTVTTSVANTAGLTATGNGTGDGLVGTGGATGDGVTGTGGSTSGAGGVFTGTGGGNGVTASGQGVGAGVVATGGATGNGVTATGGASSGTGVVATGGATGGAGGTLTATSTYNGVNGLGSGANATGLTSLGFGGLFLGKDATNTLTPFPNAGMYAIGGPLTTGSAGGHGVVGKGGSPSGGEGGSGAFGIGGVPTAGNNNGGPGIRGLGGTASGSGTAGPGALLECGTAATASAPQVAVDVRSGYLKFTGASGGAATNPNTGVAFANTLTPMNLVKAWACVQVSSGAVSLQAGFNVGTPSFADISGTATSTQIRVPFPTNGTMSGVLGVVVTLQNASPGTTSFYVPVVRFQGAAAITFSIQDSGGNVIDITSKNLVYSVIVMSAQ